MPWPTQKRVEPIALHTLEGRWQEVQGQRVLLRLDLNVPLGSDHEILCDYRIRRVTGLVWRLSRLGCRVIMISHLGRPEGRPDPELSLERFAEPLSRLLEPTVTFLPACVGPEVEEAVNNSPPGSVFLLENLRFHPGETAANVEFGVQFTRFADCFVNDAFSVSHRAHTSVVVLPQLLPSYAGPAFVNEYRRAITLVNSIVPPVVVMSGGMKLDKLMIYERLMPHIDSLLLGSGFTGTYRHNPYVLGDPEENIHRVITPPDVHVLLPSGELEYRTWEDVTPHTLAIDLGPRAIELYRERIRSAGTLLFNGSPGALPPSHPASSHNRLISAFVSSRAMKVVCGGTGCSLFIRENMARQIQFIFPGGGAILSFLDSQSNPAIQAVAEQDHATVQRAAIAYQGMAQGG